MKITKKLAAITAAIVMSVSTMAVSASAKEESVEAAKSVELVDQNANIYLTTTMMQGSDDQQEYATGKNKTGVSRYLLVTASIYEQKGNSINHSSDQHLRYTTKTGVTTGSLQTSVLTIYKADYSKPYVYNTATLYNGTVTQSGVYSEVKSADYTYAKYF